jgi:hypothetical protein
VVAPFDHKKVEAEVEVKGTLPPVQNINGPSAVIVGVDGKVLTVIIVGAETAL